MTDTPDQNPLTWDTHTMEGAAASESLDTARKVNAAADRFQRNAKLLCAARVDVVPFADGAGDER